MTMSVNQDYDVIVIGAGHAGCEAESAAARGSRLVGVDVIGSANLGGHAVARRHAGRVERLEAGGGAFVLFYIGCVILIGLPILLMTSGLVIWLRRRRR